jgi:Tol biopolymer transport system component
LSIRKITSCGSIRDAGIPEHCRSGRFATQRKQLALPKCGNPVRLTGAEEHFPTISPDGRMIAYSYDDAAANPPHGVAIMAFEGGPPTKRFDILSPMYTWFGWATDGRSLLYTKNEVGVENIRSQPIAGGTPKQITHFNSELISNFDLSRDGKRIVMSRGTHKQDVPLIRDLR